MSDLYDSFCGVGVPYTLSLHNTKRVKQTKSPTIGRAFILPNITFPSAVSVVRRAHVRVMDI